MKNFFLLIIFLWIGTLHAQHQNFLAPQEKFSIDIPNNAVRKLIETEYFTTTLSFCDLNPNDNYVISIIPADNHSCNANLFLDQHQITENESHRLEFTALSECEQIELSNTCGSINSTYYYVSVLNTSKKKDDSLVRSMGIMTSQQDPESLVTDVFLKGDCVVIENVTYQGHISAIGSFTGGDFAIGIEEGVIITSGSVNLATGPNTETGATAPWGDERGDADLEGTAGDAILDAAVLEFDFTPTGDMVSFDFVFASEEYCDFVNAAFNDAFGFYLTGPGHNGTNIARVDGPGSPPASINSVNHLSNSQYYVDNVPPNQVQFQPCVSHTPTPGPLNSLIEYDGFTVKLSAVASVEPCVPYHIKLAVGDAVDAWFDSAVFLGANSFDAASLVTIEGIVASGDPTATEGCDDAFLVFTRENIPIAEGVELNYTITGNSTATEGVDYEALSGSVTINPGSYQVQVPVVIIPDDLAEGTETIEIQMSTSLCDGLCEQIQTTTITIEDGIPLDVSFPPITTCGEASVTLSPTIGDGSGDYVYSWSDGSTGTSLDIDLTDTPTTYSVIVTDNSNCAAGVATVELAGGSAPEASIEGNAQICEEPADEIFLVTFTGNGPWTLEYSIDGSPQTPITDITDNPYELSASELGTYTLDAVSAVNCPGMTSGSATIELTEFFLIPDGSDVSCGGEADGSASISIDGGLAPYVIQWSNGETTEEIMDLPAGNYSVIVTDDNGCFSESFVEVNEPIELEAEAALDGQPDCDNPMGGEASLSISGGTEPYTFAWDNGTSEQNLTGVSGGIYNVLVTDDSGCTTMATVEIPSGGELPEAFAMSPGDISCDEPEITLSGDGTSDGTYLWTTDDGSILSGETTLTPDIDAAGTYTLTVTTADGCMASESVTIAGDASIPEAIADAPEDELNCNNDGLLSLDGSASSFGNEYTYLWTTPDGNIVDGADTDSPTIDEAGTYILTVVNTNNDCEATSEVIITENMDMPTIIIEEPESFGCNTAASSIIIDASASSTGNDFEYEWTTMDGVIDQDGNTLTPSISQGGSYTLVITNNSNGCTETMDVLVENNTSEPMADIVTPDGLSCTSTEVQLDGSGSSGAADLEYAWSTMDGSITSGQDSDIAMASGAGTYTLVITDPATGCTDMAEVMVVSDENLPVAELIDPGIFTCDPASFVLDASNSTTQSGNLDFEWSPNIDDPSTLTPEITVAGTYSITITDTENGCTAISSITIDEDMNIPDVSATEQATLTCGATSVNIEAFTTINNPSYQWYLDDVALNGETDAILDAVQSGVYTVEITNPSNNCVGTATSVVSQDDNVPAVVIENAESLTCSTTSLMLNASNSDNGTNFTYEWVASNGGNILADETTLMPEVDATGTYTLTITNSDNGCSSTDFIEISETVTLPLAVADAPNQLDCTTTEVSLTGEGSETGANISYLWSTPNGVIISDETTLNPMVGAVGEYILTVTNNDTGCSDTATAMVDENEDLPNAEIADALPLDCNLSTLDLDATASDNGTEYSFNWDVDNGGVISAGATTLTPTITEPGTYLLTITDNNSNCESITSITIAENIDEPEITPGTDYILTCGENSLTINASTTVASPDYQWLTEDGTPITGATSSDLEVMASGIYTLMVTDMSNGCSNTADISVGQDDNVPSVSIANANPLTCEDTNTTLDASASDNGTDFTFQWVASDGGNITMGETTLMPEVDATGTYTLTITNTINNCTSTDFIEITETVTLPTAAAAAPNQLSCTETEVPLTGDGSEMGANITYLWTTPNGVIISGETTLNPTVGAVGEYILTVTNTDTGCSETAIAMVDENDDLPNAEIADAIVLDCNTMALDLDATASDNGANYSFNWDVDNGGVISAGATTLTPTITEPGTYLLTITDNTSNCESITSITIAENIDEPEITPGTDYILTCGDNSLMINATTSVANPSYQWMTEDGTPIAGATASDLEVMSSGIYTLMVTDMDNGCSNTADISVGQDDNIPSISIASPNPLTCADMTMFLDASASDNGTDFSYLWTASDGGTILSGETTLMPEVSATGTYTLEITNSMNGCSSTDFTTVVEETMPPTAEAGLTLQFACGDTEATLDGTGSDEGATFTYLWSTDNGVIDSGETTLTPTVSAPGIYTITVMNTENGCTETDEVEITQDTNAPTAIAGTAESLTCIISSVTLDGSASSSGAEFTYLWTTMNGTIDNGETTLMPEVSAAGTYVLTVNNTSNNCTTSSSVTVEINDTEPNVAIASAANLTCGESSVVLDGSSSDNGANFTPVWTTLGGNIVSGGNTYMPTVDVAGTYILEITDSTNGCSSTNSIEVEVDGDTPTVVIATADQLTCNTMMLQLNADGSDFGDGYAISWSTDTGNFVDGEETLTPTIDAPGNYTLSITNNNNGCTDASNILIEENMTTATVNAGQTQTLDCTVTSLQLSGTTDLDNGEMLWTTTNGNILSDPTSLNPTINSAGTYTLTITNPDNGCSASADVTIALDPSVPEVIIATPSMLTCDVTSFTLDASETTSDQDLTFQWTSTNGNILSGADTPNPMIDAAGNYVLTILIGDNCSNTSAVEVIEDTETPTADAGTDFTINCTEPESSLDASNSSTGTNFSYQWETANGTLVNGAETAQPSISGGGLYTLTIINTTNGCAASDAVTVIDDAPESIQAQVTDPDCFNPIGSFGVNGVNGGTAPYVYSIDGGTTFQTASNFSDLDSGVYDFVVQDANDCTYEESFEISSSTALNLSLEPIAKIDFGESYQIQATINIPVDQIESIEWSPADSVSCVDCLSITVQPLETTTYFITVIDINGCDVSSSIDVIVDKQVPIYIPSAFSPDGDERNSFFTIHANDNKIKNINSLQIFNRWGELVFYNADFSPNHLESGWDGTFAGEKLNPAVFVYWTEIELQDGRVIQMKGDVSIVK